MVTVTKVEGAQPKPMRRTGFLAGRFSVPDDFDQMGAEGIEHLFEGRTE